MLRSDKRLCYEFIVVQAGACKRPYFMEPMGIHLYSSQELSYVIFNHPMLVLDDFVDERLFNLSQGRIKSGLFGSEAGEVVKKRGESG